MTHTHLHKCCADTCVLAPNVTCGCLHTSARGMPVLMMASHNATVVHHHGGTDQLCQCVNALECLPTSSSPCNLTISIPSQDKVKPVRFLKNNVFSNKLLISHWVTGISATSHPSKWRELVWAVGPKIKRAFVSMRTKNLNHQCPRQLCCFPVCPSSHCIYPEHTTLPSHPQEGWAAHNATLPQPSG